MYELLVSRRVWGGILAIFGAFSGGAVLTETQIMAQTDQIVIVIGAVSSLIGGVLSFWSKLRPSKS